jgi:formylglycine-generating enzyme required for sulfatase activity
MWQILRPTQVDLILLVAIFTAGSVAAAIPGDVYPDGIVDFKDCNVIAEHWLSPGGDIDGDGTTDFNDFAIMADHWSLHEPDPNEMVEIPAGEFDMGDHYGVGRADELPVHTVYVDSVYMGRYEITNQQYCDFLNAADVKVVGNKVFEISDSTNWYPYFTTYGEPPYGYSQIAHSDGTFSVRSRDGYSMADHPVVFVSWRGAVAYCNWRSDQDDYEQCYDISAWQCDLSKRGYRLPTEAEWEHAARGGCLDPYYEYPWCDNAINCTKANYYYGSTCNPLGLSSDPHTAPVGYYSANNFDLYDMAGNVAQWCNDWYGSEHYSVSGYDNPTGPASGDRRIIRGGTWASLAQHCRVALRSWNYPSGSSYSTGFRLALDLD